MYPSTALCRAQEAHHLERAAEASLENVRAVAAMAASAWGKEALLAEAREARHRRTVALRASGGLAGAPARAGSTSLPAGAER